MSNVGVGATESRALGGLAPRLELLSSGLVILGAALCFATWAYEYFGAFTSSGIGPKQLAGLALGGATTAAGVALKYTVYPDARRELAQFWGVALQIVLLAVVINVYKLENRAFFELVFPLIAAGFVIHHHLTPEWRKPFFFFLALASFLGVFASDAEAQAWLIGLAFALFVVANLPIALWARAALLVVAGAAFAALRVGWIEASWAGMVLPILSAMFIFRLVIYLYDRESGKGPTNIWQRLSYFFLPPNVVFPFFPVVDFATFGRSYYNQDALRIYQRGATWILRGLIHLLIYRVIYLYGVVAPESVESAGEFLRFITMNFGLYLRISGMFHLITGTILLFGYNLPETHTRFYFSNSFIDFWRRINIYWKDFMQKMVFTPAFVRLHRAGAPELTAIVASVFAVFFATWALHAYQWFWLRGTLLLTLPDMMFWGVLACLLAFQTVYEARAKKAPAPARAPLLGPRVSLVVRTACTFLTICLMWSLWTSESPAAWGRVWVDAGLLPAFDPDAAAGVGAWALSLVVMAMVAVMVAVTAGMGFGVLSAVAPAAKRRPSTATRPVWLSAPVVGSALAVVLLVVQSPAVELPRDSAPRELVQDLRIPRLNAQDQELLRRGYYENLTDVARFSSRLWELYASRPRASSDIEGSTITRPRDDAVRYEFVPNTSAAAHGVTYAINSWGMRDYEITKEKPEGVVRIAFTGASTVAGWGVDLEDRFDTVLAESLNAKSGERRIETFNLGIDGHQAIDRIVLFDDRAWEFEPDVMVYFAHSTDWSMHTLATSFVERSLPEDWFLADLLRQAGVTRAMSINEVERRLDAMRDEIVAASYRYLGEQARRRGVTPLWAYLPLVGEAPEDPERLGELAAEAGFTVIAFEDVFEGYESAAVQLQPWDSHPNPFGHQLMATRLEEDLRALESQGIVDLWP